ncbi:Regulator of protease activity HflC, stomatin/prohibitin superfamily [Lutibacter agarilyticus]|uniref:Regulator of protease activity HflC, stomatin/prohibitin superfamily n=1 Tax=Lutibacter agarilyticus TaxID=1109740 RepID=A0A238VCN8_9FLAO|nr:prohibitin family protein [Lutibacter agarilyticus]SNR31924.1 Regulator of protease activity HflC, stomatin/prohibitin superfamily [Lutibacter agarilyticus]
MANNAQLQLPKTLMPIILIGIVAIIFLSKSTVTIDAGEAGVLWKRFDGGVVTDQPPLGEGFHIVAPWNNVIVYEVRQQELYETMKVLSSNGLDILLETSTWYLPKADELGYLHQKIGENYLERIIKPALRSAARSVVGRYTPEQLYSSKRDVIQNEIFEETRTILDDEHIQLNEVLVRDVTLPPTIKDAIERKLKQEQESLEYEFRLVTAAKEAEKVIIEAEGKAESNRILSASLNDQILRDKGIEATLELANSPNSKVIVIGSGKNGMPIILGNQ